MFDKVSRFAIATSLTFLATASVVSASPKSVPPKPKTPPNILLIIADDVGLDVTPGLYPGLKDRLLDLYGPKGHNNPDYKKIDGRPASTPVLDKFARQGMVFTDAWAQPYCSPTRASLLTGLYVNHTDVATYADALSQNHDSFVTHLKNEAGYRTAIFGKWHMAGLPAGPREPNAKDYPGMKPKEAGFELFRGGLHAALPSYWNYDQNIQDADTAPGVWKTVPAQEHSLKGIAPTTYAAVAKAADTIEWIKQQQTSQSGKPWFAWLAFNLSHATAGGHPSQMIIPNADTLDAPTRKEIDACGGKYGSADPGHCSGETQMRAMTNSMDTIIGRILDVVDKVPNTYVIIISDNGTPMYGRPNLDFIDNMYITRKGRGKGTSFESGAHVMFAIRGPGVKPGSVSREFVHVVDLYSTILEIAGLQPPKDVPNSAGDMEIPLDSISLKPIMFGKAKTVRNPSTDSILTESVDLLKEGQKVVGVRNANYKIVCTNSSENCAFYNLSNDPLEEYPLPKPQKCDVPLRLSVNDPNWNFCFLTGVAAKSSIVHR